MVVQVPRLHPCSRTAMWWFPFLRWATSVPLPGKPQWDMLLPSHLGRAHGTLGGVGGAVGKNPSFPGKLQNMKYKQLQLHMAILRGISGQGRGGSHTGLSPGSLGG